MSSALVLGASGYLGRYLVNEVDARGHRVRPQPSPGGAGDAVGWVH
ncbi:hypothetical protein [Gephyromycinifex aptenodytis]|nr:hypothetical protein [Gephyromycinifex aptenodytis]